MSRDPPSMLIGPVEVARYVLGRLDRLEELLMALSESQQAAVDRMSAALADLDADIAAAFRAAQATNQQLRDTIVGLEAIRDSLRAENVADDATIADLTAQIEALRQQQATADRDVVGALDGLTTKVAATDKAVEDLGAT